MGKKSAGILVFRKKGEFEFLLAHPGGPFWAKKDAYSWSIPKGEFEDDEDPLSAARREFYEETGFTLTGEFIKLDPVKQAGGKTIYIWAVYGDFDATAIKSNSFRLEWPIKSGLFKDFPEVDRADWFKFEVAREKILRSQLPVLENLINILDKSL